MESQDVGKKASGEIQKSATVPLAQCGVFIGLRPAASCFLVLRSSLIRETPLPVPFFLGILHAPRSPHFLKKSFFSIFPEVIFQTFWGSRWDPTWDPKKVLKLFSKVIFGGPRPSPPRTGRVADFRKKCRMLRAGGPFSWRGRSGAALGGEPFGIPKK